MVTRRVEIPGAKELNLCELERTGYRWFEAVERNCNEFPEFWQVTDNTVYLYDRFCEEDCVIIAYPNSNPVDVLLNTTPTGPIQLELPAYEQADSPASLYFIDLNRVLINTMFGQYWILHPDKAPTYLGSRIAPHGGSLSLDYRWLMVPMPQDAGDWSYRIWNLFEEIPVFEGLHKGYKEIVVRFFEHGFAYLVLELAEPKEAFFFSYEDRITIPLPAYVYFDATPGHDFLCKDESNICIYHLGDPAVTTILDNVSLMSLSNLWC